jgi:hypothetical protein
VQTLRAALAMYDDNIETYARLSLAGDDRVQGNVDGRVDALLQDPRIRDAGIDRAWLHEHEIEIEVAARARELRANIEDTPASAAKTYTSYELMKSEVADRLNAYRTAQALAVDSPASAAIAAQAARELERLAQSPDSYKPIVIYEAQRETTTDTQDHSAFAVMDVEVAKQASRSRAST